MRRLYLGLALAAAGFGLAAVPSNVDHASAATAASVSRRASVAQADVRLRGAFRNPAKDGWTYVHLEGTPEEMGYQNGNLLAPEIADLLAVDKLETQHDYRRGWNFFRDAAKQVLWPHIEQQYREEMQGIADGAAAKDVKVDIWDVVAMNEMMEWSYYVGAWDRRRGSVPPPAAVAPEHCSAFIATGSYTRDGHIVMAHNDWTSYLDGERWYIVYDVVPSQGHRFLMDGLPGVIHSADDFGVNSEGIMITETTISSFHGYDFDRVPEFVRARKAMQYAGSIDEFARIIEEGNNGGYANDWLVGDRKTNEIASLELGLKNVTLDRLNDGFFVSSNFPINPKLVKEETDFNVNDPKLSENARHTRWLQLMAEYKGKIDVAAAEKFMADHYDVILKKDQPSERTLDGHVDLSPRGMGGWQRGDADAGAVQNKVIDSTLAARIAFLAHAGHACGLDFKAASYLAAHKDASWQQPLLRDMIAYPWSTFEATNANGTVSSLPR